MVSLPCTLAALSGVKMLQDQGINTTFFPFFQENGEKWLMTTPYFQVALNRDLTKDETRRKKAMKVLEYNAFRGCTEPDH